MTPRNNDVTICFLYTSSACRSSTELRLPLIYTMSFLRIVIFGFCILSLSEIIIAMMNDDSDDIGDAHDDDNEDFHPANSTRHLHSYSTAQKVRYLDDFIQCHILGHDYARTATSYAQRHGINPRTFRRWVTQEEEIRQSLVNNPTRDGRRRRRRPETGGKGSLLNSSNTLVRIPSLCNLSGSRTLYLSSGRALYSCFPFPQVTSLDG